MHVTHSCTRYLGTLVVRTVPVASSAHSMAIPRFFYTFVLGMGVAGIRIVVVAAI